MDVPHVPRDTIYAVVIRLETDGHGVYLFDAPAGRLGWRIPFTVIQGQPFQAAVLKGLLWLIRKL